MGRQWRILVAVVGIVSCLAGFAHAAPPSREFPYSKQTSLLPGAYTFVFSLYSPRTAATPLWTSERVALTLKSPVLVYALGSGTVKIPSTIDFSQQLYVKVVKTSPGAAVIVANRERLPIVPYALHSASVSPGSVNSATILDGSVASADLEDGAALGEILDDDGSGSGLDADLLDGQHASAFAASTHSHDGTFINEGQGDSVTSAMIVDGTIANADIAPGAAIADSKLAQITSADKVAASALPGTVMLSDAAQSITGVKTFRTGTGAPFAVDAGDNSMVANLHAERASTAARADSAANADSAGTLDGQTLTDLDVRYGTVPPSPSGTMTGFSTYTLDALGGPSEETSITIGIDGLPIISYCDSFNGDLRILHCSNPRCSEGAITTPDMTGDVGYSSSITIGADGLPLVSYVDRGSGVLKLLRCGSVDCSSGNAITTLDDVAQVGSHTSIAIGADGFPIVCYANFTDFNLRILHCGTADCSAGNTIVEPDTAGFVGYDCSITIGADGLPVVSYSDQSNGDLKVLHCGNAGCSAGNSVVAPDSAGNVGYNTSIAIGADGLPVVSYTDMGNANLNVLHCGNADCSAGNSVTTPDAAIDTGYNTSLAIGTDGFPLVSYYENDTYHLRLLDCGDAACSSGNSLVFVDSSADVGSRSSITVGADGHPVISYTDDTNGTLKAAKGFVRPLGRR